MATIYRINEAPHPLDAGRIQQTQAQKIVGGNVDYIILYDDKIMLVEKDAKLKNRPFNDMASMYAQQAVYGNAILCECWQFSHHAKQVQ